MWPADRPPPAAHPRRPTACHGAGASGSSRAGSRSGSVPGGRSCRQPGGRCPRRSRRTPGWRRRCHLERPVAPIGPTAPGPGVDGWCPLRCRGDDAGPARDRSRDDPGQGRPRRARRSAHRSCPGRLPARHRRRDRRGRAGSGRLVGRDPVDDGRAPRRRRAGHDPGDRRSTGRARRWSRPRGTGRRSAGR